MIPLPNLQCLSARMDAGQISTDVATAQAASCGRNKLNKWSLSASMAGLHSHNAPLPEKQITNTWLPWICTGDLCSASSWHLVDPKLDNIIN